MISASSHDIPSWKFPRNWEETVETAGKAAQPRVRQDSVTLDGKPASLARDIIAVTQFAGSGILYKNAGKKAHELNAKHPPLADAPRVKMRDPLVIAPGWTTEPEKFDMLVEHLLSSKQNGDRAVYLKDGKPYSDTKCTKATAIAPSDKVFVAVFDSTLDAPDVSAPQLEAAVKAVQASGSEKVDVLGYSMGGLAVRKMLDNGTVKVDQVAQLGTANRGTRFATLAAYIIRRDIQWAMSLGGINVDHLPAMDWLSTWDPQNPQSNPGLDALNKTLPRQLSNANEFLSIGANGVSTLSKSWGGTSGGDGLVPSTSVALPGIPTKLLPGKGNKQHGNLPHDPDVFAELKSYFGWERMWDKPAGGG
jgi:hypothetical protein